jgi:di/tricarboxylate transporter
MTPDIAILLALTVAALVFFSFEWVSADVVALGLLLSLALLGLVPLDRAFSGFGSDTFILILGLLIMTAALVRTGVVDLLGRTILRHSGKNPKVLYIVLLVAAAAFSAFMSNTAAAALFIPVVFGIAKRARISPGKLLMPLAFATIVSSSVSLISTSTNIVVSGLMQQHKMAPMGMFEMAPIGVPIAILGVLYMIFIGKKLVPDRFQSSAEEGDSTLVVRPYLFEILIHDDSPLAGKTVAKSGLGRDLELTLVRIIRNKNEYHEPRAGSMLRGGDVIIVEGSSDDIVRIKDIPGIDIKADVKLSDPAITPDEQELAEVLVLPGSPLIGRTLKGAGFRERYDLQVLGLSRRGETMHKKMSTIPIKVGDILLVQGRREQMIRVSDQRIFSILGMLEEERPKVKHAPWAMIIFALVILLPTFKLVTLPVAVMLGVFAVFVTRCLSSEEAYQAVEWKVLVLVASMLSLGVAMEHTGAAAYLADLIVSWVGDASPYWLLSAFFGLTVLLTQPMSNQAAAVVVLPIAIQTALQLEVNPRTFAMMIAVAASCSYLTPLEPACLMVYGPGRYRFFDYLRVGGPLTLVIFVVAILLVPRVWPL